MSWIVAECAQRTWLWVLIGLFGQGVFFTRFFYQWIVSERHGRSVIPDAFWYISIAGAAITLVYGINQREPVIMFSQAVGLMFYSRNIYLIWRARRRPTVQPTPGAVV
jgi:lipid-A-disaccharide synthase-like uncharacterized protein